MFNNTVRYLLLAGILSGIVIAGVLMTSPGMILDVQEDTLLPSHPTDHVTTEDTVSDGSDSEKEDRDFNISSRSPRESDALEFEEPRRPWFEEVGTEVGLELFNVSKHVPEDKTLPPPKEGDGSGVYVSDYDRDGWTDILAIIYGDPVLFRNTGGNFMVSDELTQVDYDVEAAHFLDYDNDGWDELYLMSNEKSRVYQNEQGGFRAVEVGLNVSYEAVRGASSADYTGNGCLDLFVVQAGDWDTNQPEGYNDFVPISEDNGNRNRLFRGMCGEFEETTEEAGIRGEAWSLATSFVDLTNDGNPDIHVANDFNNDVIYINTGDGDFIRHVLPNFTNRNGMSSEVADVNDDGLLDIFVSNIHHVGSPGTEARFGGRVKGNNLLMNQGRGEFVDRAEQYSVRIGGFGWAASLSDFNNDGWIDLYQSNSLVWGSRPPNFWRGGEDPFTRLNGSSLGFVPAEHQGVAMLDYDNDGHLDMATSVITRRAPFYENQIDSGSWLMIDLRDRSNHTSMGARVEVIAGNHSWTRVKSSKSDYFSQGTRNLHFGLGDVERVAEIRVKWPDGEEDSFKNVKVNRRLDIFKSGRMLED